MKLRPGDAVITLRLPIELKRKLEEAAAKEHRSLTQFLIFHLEELIKSEEQR